MLSLALALACTDPLGSPARPSPPPNPASLDVQGATARLLVDRDAVAAAFPVGDRVVQRTPGGAVVIRRAVDFGVERVVLGPAPASVIGLAGDTVLVGFRDGETATLDPASGTLTPGARVVGQPVWLGEAAGRRIAVGLEGRGGGGAVQVVGIDDGRSVNGVFELPSPGFTAPPTAAAASETTLWLGWDWGEWGGALVAVDLKGGHASAESSSGVYGLARLGDAVLGFGGIDHMGMSQGWVAWSLANGPPLYQGGNYSTAPVLGPSGPVTGLIRDGAGFTVLSYSDVWHTDSTFTAWTRIGTLDVHYRSGRTDAVGTYPAVASAWYDPAGGLVLGTQYDGFRTFTAPATTRGPEPAVGTGDRLWQVLATDRGVVALLERGPFLVGEAGLVRWDDALADQQSYDVRWDTDADRHLRRTSVDAGRVVTITWAGTGTNTSLLPTPGTSGVLRDADGTLAVEAGYSEPARVQVGGEWAPLQLPVQQAYLFLYSPVAGVPGLYRLRDGGLAWRTAIGGIHKLELAHEDAADAVRWGADTLVLENGALSVWDTATDRTSPLSVALPEHAGRLAIDGCGRLWVAGETLLVLSRDASLPLEGHGLNGRTWTSMVGLADGVALTDGLVVAEVRTGCPPG